MGENPTSTATGARSRIKRHRGAIGLVASGVVAGGILAGTLGASAATTATTATPSASSSSAASATAPTMPAQSKSATPVRSDEKAVSASVAATLKSKALAKVPGATAYRVETDAGDGAYEVHMTKSDGSLVTVKFDKNLNVTTVETGMGTGDPHLGGGAPGGGPRPSGASGGYTG